MTVLPWSRRVRQVWVDAAGQEVEGCGAVTRRLP